MDDNWETDELKQQNPKVWSWRGDKGSFARVIPSVYESSQHSTSHPEMHICSEQPWPLANGWKLEEKSEYFCGIGLMKVPILLPNAKNSEK